MLDRVRRARRAGDGGVSLVELVVAMAVGSVLLLALGTVLAGTLRGSVSATQRVTSSAELRTALDTMSRRLRVAVVPIGQPTAFTTATSTSVSFYANLVPAGSTGCPAAAPATGTGSCAPTRIDYAVARSDAPYDPCPGPGSTLPRCCLWETRTTPSGTAATGLSWDVSAGAVQSRTCLARQVDPGTLQLAYYPTSNDPLPPAAPVPALATPVADPAVVQSIAVDLALRAGALGLGEPGRHRLTLVNLLPTP